MLNSRKNNHLSWPGLSLWNRSGELSSLNSFSQKWAAHAAKGIEVRKRVRQRLSIHRQNEQSSPKKYSTFADPSEIIKKQGDAHTKSFARKVDSR